MGNSASPRSLASIFGVFQNDIKPDPASDWNDVYFDLAVASDAQEPQCLALAASEVDPRRHFPLKTLFNPVEYHRATEPFGDVDLQVIDDMQSRFKEAVIPYQLLDTEERAKVAIVFERINRMGVPLDTLQLLTAWTWSEDFDLHQEFEELREELEPFGFAGVGEDSTLLLRCCAAVLAGDASPNTLVSLNGSDVRGRFEEIVRRSSSEYQASMADDIGQILDLAVVPQSLFADNFRAFISERATRLSQRAADLMN